MASSSMMRMLAGLACYGMVCGEEYQTEGWRASLHREAEAAQAQCGDSSLRSE
jgi:hypothetical protein